MYLVDTNVISELRKNKPHGAVVAWIKSVDPDEIFVSAVTLGELQAGIEITRRLDPEKADQIETWLDQVADSYQVFPMDGRTFREWARLMNGRPHQLIEDAMLAATARVHRLTVVTRNTRDFQAFGVQLFNPFIGK
ncbi:MAG: type II toxin-antitoxin system VapC family toxin [Bryobacteraceae bacterium]